MSTTANRLAALTPEQRALLLKRLKHTKEHAPSSQIPRQARNTNKFPLAFSQERIWFNYQWDPKSPLYNEAVSLRIDGALQIELLEQSLSKIVERHEILRTTFHSAEGRPFQSIMPAMPARVTVIDLQTTMQPQEAEIERQIRAQAQQPFDLAAGPVFRATLLRLNETTHIFLLTLHHIVIDGMSAGIFAKELFTLYDAFARQTPAKLDELPIQYADYAAWQRTSQDEKKLQEQLAYWQEQLAGAPAALELSTDRPRPPMPSGQGAHEQFIILGHIAHALKTLAREEGATLFMTMLAAFQALLYRYTGQESIVVGTPIANRNHRDLSNLLGCFINTLALRGELTEAITFRTLLGQMRERTMGAYANQELPFEKLVEAQHATRDLSRSPIFQTLFELKKDAQRPVSPPGLMIEPQKVYTGTTKFDLGLTVLEIDDDLEGVFEYSTDLFEQTTIQRMVDHFQNLLVALVADPDQPIAAMPLLTIQERQQLLVDWNATQVNYPTDKCLHELFERQVAQTPDAPALLFEDITLSYHQLNQRINQLAHHLRSCGVGPGMLVGICMERSIEMVVGLYGILKAGGAYVPLDPTYPQERLAFMLSDAQTTVLLTQQKLVDALPQHNAQLICLDTDWPIIAQESIANPVNITTADDLAYMIYTSGSTGDPKGAMNAHRGICNRLFWMQDAYQLNETDRVLQKTPFSFDVSVWEFFWPLMTGAALVVARPEGHKDPRYLVETIQRCAITTLHFVPSMLQIFVAEPSIEDCHTLRRVICSGEALPADLQRRFFARIDAELHNLYGPTEAAVDVTFWACRRDDTRALVPIGRPIANTQMYILDRRLNPVPIGVPGELHIGGVQVGLGYLNRPELMAAKFIKDPFADDSSARLYKTGDLCRYLPDGTIEFLGRIDFQVKVRGFRIELGEIEATLVQHTAVREVVVVARSDPSGTQRLLAYVVRTEGADVTSAALRTFLLEKLPEHMIPNLIMMLPKMPLLPNGKINRRALPDPDLSAFTHETDYVAPQTETATKLAAIWAALLGVAQVGIHDNFFTMGGHSLLATQLISRLRTELGSDLPLRTIFENPTIAELELIVTTAQQTSIVETTPIRRRVRRRQQVQISDAGELVKIQGES